MKLNYSGDVPSQTVNAEWYSGQVWTTALAESEAPQRLHVVLATFAPGARTAWHTHPYGQILIATSGSGRVQLAGEPAKTLNPGDSVTIAPGERHWHGAGPDQVFTHISIQGARPDGTMADWSDLVTDEVYAQAARETHS
ncbi:cupin domain-containing protein [uncultured Caballeronia sp.]|uniref:(R)-mandelonitrile lyase n=1 Tax=uncultured Caballeronia sp. TaxID=1827198 RepID=UPI0035C98E23